MSGGKLPAIYRHYPDNKGRRRREIGNAKIEAPAASPDPRIPAD
jgi:hypothetical protein